MQQAALLAGGEGPDNWPGCHSWQAGFRGGHLIQSQCPFVTQRKPLIGRVVLAAAAGLGLGANLLTSIGRSSCWILGMFKGHVHPWCVSPSEAREGTDAAREPGPCLSLKEDLYDHCPA